jgi:hypothetical protein
VQKEADGDVQMGDALPPVAAAAEAVEAAAASVAAAAAAIPGSPPAAALGTPKVGQRRLTLSNPSRNRPGISA